jgi:hypothetical protein
MSAIDFDVHAFVKRLTAAGVPESQARVLADEQRRFIAEIRLRESKLKVEILEMLMLGAFGLEIILVLALFGR